MHARQRKSVEHTAVHQLLRRDSRQGQVTTGYQSSQGGAMMHKCSRSTHTREMHTEPSRYTAEQAEQPTGSPLVCLVM
jgi:hypothetical protein